MSVAHMQFGVVVFKGRNWILLKYANFLSSVGEICHEDGEASLSVDSAESQRNVTQF